MQVEKHMSRSKSGVNKADKTRTVLHAAPESPAAPGRTNRKLWFLCWGEKEHGAPWRSPASVGAACGGWAVWAA